MYIISHAHYPRGPVASKLKMSVSVGQVLCDSCKTREGRYRCPGCSRRSCSVECVQQHKREHQCSGRRDKTAFLSVSSFTDAHLLSDYHFLEDVNRFIGSMHRDEAKQLGRQTWQRTKRMNHLKGAASKHGVRFVMVAPSLSLHKSNTSRVLYSKATRCQTILWRIHWLFHNCGEEYFTKEASEDVCLSKHLERFIHPVKSDPVIRHRLRDYVQQGGAAGVKVFMRVERAQLLEDRYHQLDTESSLAANLRGKTVVEYPKLHVVLNGSRDLFPLYSETDKERLAEHTDKERLVDKERVVEHTDGERIVQDTDKERVVEHTAVSVETGDPSSGVIAPDEDTNTPAAGEQSLGGGSALQLIASCYS